MMDEMPYDDDFQLNIYGDIWASMICSIEGEILGDIVLILSLEGNLIAAQNQQTLNTYLKSRYG